jgi:hypothetical protein
MMRFGFNCRGFFAAWCFCITFNAWAQATPVVQDILPADLPSYLASNHKVMVLFTSPDPKCGYCVGADAGFEQAVQKLGRSDWRFVRVQWAPWRAFPPEVEGLKVSAIPSRAAVVQRRVVGWADGRVPDVDLLAQGLKAAMAGKNWSPPRAQRPATAPAPAARGADERKARGSSEPVNLADWLRPMQPGWAEVQGRRTFMLALRQRCLSRHPQTEQVLRSALNQWGRKALQIVMDPSQVGWLEKEEGKRAVAEQEAKFAQTMQTQTGLSHVDELAAEDCERLMNAAAAVPLPVVSPAPPAPKIR